MSWLGNFGDPEKKNIEFCRAWNGLIVLIKVRFKLSSKENLLSKFLVSCGGERRNKLYPPQLFTCGLA